ncbi:hypothetical protein SDC9_210784 [bioreactor metagenome]|uniref:Uncharacterized protein n=1 Tax=bioreactor metagenome TaxID=1076179 RepID=A0A645JIT7_9ZZZZ
MSNLVGGTNGIHTVYVTNQLNGLLHLGKIFNDNAVSILQRIILNKPLKQRAIIAQLLHPGFQSILAADEGHRCHVVDAANFGVDIGQFVTPDIVGQKHHNLILRFKIPHHIINIYCKEHRNSHQKQAGHQHADGRN